MIKVRGRGSTVDPGRRLVRALGEGGVERVVPEPVVGEDDGADEQEQQHHAHPERLLPRKALELPNQRDLRWRLADQGGRGHVG